MKALVMGGNRFFGKRLVATLLERGVDVTVLNRGNRPDPFGDKVKRILMDRKALDKTHPALAAGGWDIVYDQICYDALDARLACETFAGKTCHYVFISSQSVYPENGCFSEAAFDPAHHALPATDATKADYAEAKRQAEAVFFQSGMPALTAVRFPIVLGEDDYTERLKSVVQLVQAGKNIFLPNADAKISFLHAADAARLLASLLDRKIAGPVNCAAAEPIALKDLIATIESVLGKRAKVTAKQDEGEATPFGLSADWFMSTQKLQASGFRVLSIKEWLPGLVRTLAESESP